MIGIATFLFPYGLFFQEVAMLNHNTNQILHAIDEVVEVAEQLDEETRKRILEILDRIIDLVENKVPIMIQ